MDLTLEPQQQQPLIESGLNFKTKDVKAQVYYYFKIVRSWLFSPLIHFILVNLVLIQQIADIKKLCQKENLKAEDVFKYVRTRKMNKSKELKITKFCEAFWRFLFYGLFCVIGICVLFYPVPQPWVKDTREHWRNLLTEGVLPSVAFYYHVQLGCYIHQLMWTEVTRSDALEMIVHHLVTIMLLLFSWCTNFTRIGSSILLVHDIADIFLEAGKCVNYVSINNKNSSKWATKVCDGLFAIFTITFAFSRLFVYPYYLVSSLLFEAREEYGMWSGWWVFAILLCTLQCLHVFWFYLIMRMVVRMFSTGKVVKDVRSDDDEDPMTLEHILHDEDKPAVSVPGVSASMSAGKRASKSRTG
jgi:hypothetical protein